MRARLRIVFDAISLRVFLGFFKHGDKWRCIGLERFRVRHQAQALQRRQFRRERLRYQDCERRRRPREAIRSWRVPRYANARLWTSGEPLFRLCPRVLQERGHIGGVAEASAYAGRGADHDSPPHLRRVARSGDRIVLRSEKMVRIIIEQNRPHTKRLSILVIARPPVGLDVVMKFIVRSRWSENWIEESD